jgi:hypothetical protein
MNSSIDQAIIDEAYETDPESAKAEYGAQFRDDLADYITREAIDKVTMWGRRELPPMPGIAYTAFCDPSGGISDSMTLAVAHLSPNDTCILDSLLVVPPPFNPESAVKQCAELLRRYGIATVTGDHYAGEWPVARFSEHGIEFIQCARPKSALYQDLLPLINAGRIELLEHSRLSSELCNLERRTARSGKDSIDHSPGGHDDVANAVAGVLTNIDLDRRPALVDMKKVVGGDGNGATEPRHLQYVLLMIADNGPDIGVVFAGSVRSDYDNGRHEPLFVLDVDTLYFKPGLFGELTTRLIDHAAYWHARAVIFAPEHLAPAIERFGLPVEMLPPHFDAETLVPYTSEMIDRGLVKFCSATVAKMQSRPIAAAMSLRAGDAAEGALRQALVAATYVKFAAA